MKNTLASLIGFTPATISFEAVRPVMRSTRSFSIRRDISCTVAPGLLFESAVTTSTGMPPSFPPSCSSARSKPRFCSAPTRLSGPLSAPIQPSLILSCACTAPASAASSAAVKMRFMRPPLDVNVALDGTALALELSAAARKDDASLFHHRETVGQARERDEIAVHDQRRLAAFLQHAERAPDLLAHERRETLRRFIQDQHRRLR